MSIAEAQSLLGHADDLRALAWCLVRSDGAEDLLQDAWVAALSSENRPRSPRAWLRQVLRNEFRLRIRSQRRRLARERVALIETLEASPDDVAMRIELTREIDGALERLDEPYRGVVRQRFLLGRSPAEIAAHSGAPAATVRWQIHEGLQRIRVALDERYGDRRQWCGGAVAIAAAPAARRTSPALGVRMLGKLTVVKLVLGGAVGVAAVTLAVGASSSRAAVGEAAREDDSRASAQAQAGASVSGSAEPALTRAREPSDIPTDAKPIDPTTCGETCQRPIRQVLSDPAGLHAVFQSCAHLVPKDTPPGRFEVEVGIRGGPAGNTITSVDVTRGRKLPCVDPDADFDEPDGPDVRRFAAVAECIEHSLEPDFVNQVPDGEAYGMLDVVGDVALDEQRAAAKQWALPEPSAAVQGLEPEQAVATLSLPAQDGAAGGQVSIIECGGYECSYCNQARATMDELRAVYGDRVSMYFLQTPLDMHAGAPLTSRAAVAAAAQGRFWAMHEALFDRPGVRSEAAIVELAGELDLDIHRFTRDLHSAATAQTVADQREVCTQAGARGTPAFFVDGDLVTGNRDVAAFREIIDEALEHQTG